MDSHKQTAVADQASRGAGSATSQLNSQSLTTQKTAVGRFAAANPVLLLSLAAVVQGLLIASWSFAVAMKLSHFKASNLLDESALYAAQELARVYVSNPSFGKVGLCDLNFDSSEGRAEYVQAKFKVTGVHHLYETLTNTRSLGEYIHNPTLQVMASQDLLSARQVEQQLCDRLHMATSPASLEPFADDNGSPKNTVTEQPAPNKIYRDIYRMLSADNGSGQQHLKEVKIRLGRGSESKMAWPYHGPALIDSGSFVSTKDDSAPYLVLIEATYKVTGPKDENGVDLVKTACASITAPRGRARSSAFIFNFPDGLPKEFNSVQSLLDYNEWNASGDWQQAVGTEVPGKGSLAPSLEPVLPEMTPSKALATALYHWLRQIGPTVDKTRLALLLKTPWSRPLKVQPHTSQQAVANGISPTQLKDAPNSGLLLDTGAREYAILNQTGPGGVGQVGLSHVFDIPTRANSPDATRQIPSSTIPLYVNDEGRVNLPGANSFDEQMLQDYLKESYATNLSASESISAAKLAMARANLALSQLEQKTHIEQQELNSIENRMIRVGLVPVGSTHSRINNQAAEKVEPTEKKKAAEKGSVEEKVAALHREILHDNQQRVKLINILQLTKATLYNAERVSNITYDMCLRANTLMREGLSQIDGARHKYLLSNKFIFTPILAPIEEGDFFEEHACESSPWCQKTMEILKPCDPKDSSLIGMTVKGASLLAYLKQPLLNQSAQQTIVLIDSNALEASSNAGIQTFSIYPYNGLRIPNGQLFYYSHDAFRSGSKPVVSWSVALRDLVASKPADAYSSLVGEPLPSISQGWCKDDNARHQCPGLACEFQLRTPLPIWPRAASGLSLTNVLTNAQVQQVPPLPADML